MDATNYMNKARLIVVALMSWSFGLHAATLPQDRADVMYHSYDGGGLEVHGPSVLVRKGFAESVSLWGNYYIDMLSSASVDVMATASPYEERRVEWSAGSDFVHEKTSMGLAFTSSEEDDYSARTLSFGISQDFFGDLTTLGISYARGWDEVRKRNEEDFERDVDRRSYRFDISQIISKSLIMSFNYQTISDEGFLNNPYRSVRFLDGSERGFSYEAEMYPNTRTTNAAALRGKYYLPYRAALLLEGRGFQDSFGIDSWDLGVEYTHPFGDALTFEGRYRYYTQTAADFYSDLFPRQTAQNFLARDKELSTFNSHTIGAGVTYDAGEGRLPWVENGSVTLQLDYMMYQYDDFRDVTAGGAAGEEPLYEFEALVLRGFFSVYF